MTVKDCVSALLVGVTWVVGSACGEPPIFIEGQEGAGPPMEIGDREEPLQTVTGRWYQQCRQRNGVSDRVFDLRALTFQAFVPDDSPSGYRVIQGAGHEGSLFSIPDVPRGEYLLRLGSSSYFVTDQRELDARIALDPRCNPFPTPSEQETPVTFQLSGMTPYSRSIRWPLPQDTIEIMSPTALFSMHGLLPEQMPPSGGTELDMVQRWPRGFPLLDAAHGDELLVYHWRDVFDGDGDPRNRRLHSARVAADLFQTSAVTLHDGVPATVSGAFQQLAPNKTLAFSLDRGLFDAGYGPMSYPHSFWLEIGTDRGHPITSTNLRNMERSTSLVQTIEGIPYADPFPAGWGRTAAVYYHNLRAVASPSGARNWLLFGSVRSQLPFSGPLPAGPQLSPPAAATVAGLPFEEGGAVPFDGQGPLELRWRSVPAATAYEIRIYPIGESAAPRSIATFVTQRTSLRIPASVLAGSEFYSFNLQAVRSGTRHEEGELLSNEVTSYASIYSGRFRLSSSCGDGVVQAGEACDTAGPSASCNADCTASVCGDGFANAASGEVCDSARENVLGCDYDCSLPACGDGVLNSAVEDCDDGNPADTGNGCSAQCKYNNVCGNGVVEGLPERCDGNGVDTATCNADCTFPFCGDGYVNRAAGEQCDDLFRSDPGCSATCQIIAP